MFSQVNSKSPLPTFFYTSKTEGELNKDPNTSSEKIFQNIKELHLVDPAKGDVASVNKACADRVAYFDKDRVISEINESFQFLAKKIENFPLIKIENVLRSAIPSESEVENSSHEGQKYWPQIASCNERLFSLNQIFKDIVDTVKNNETVSRDRHITKVCGKLVEEGSYEALHCALILTLTLPDWLDRSLALPDLCKPLIESGTEEKLGLVNQIKKDLLSSWPDLMGVDKNLVKYAIESIFELLVNKKTKQTLALAKEMLLYEPSPLNGDTFRKEELYLACIGEGSDESISMSVEIFETMPEYCKKSLSNGVVKVGTDVSLLSLYIDERY